MGTLMSIAHGTFLYYYLITAPYCRDHSSHLFNTFKAIVWYNKGAHCSEHRTHSDHHTQREGYI